MLTFLNNNNDDKDIKPKFRKLYTQTRMKNLHTYHKKLNKAIPKIIQQQPTQMSLERKSREFKGKYLLKVLTTQYTL